MTDRGTTLIEVLVAILLCMGVCTAAVKISALSMRSGRTSENLTYAAVYAHTKLASLVNLPSASPDLRPGWHRDRENPIEKDKVMFYRYWQVEEMPEGKRVTLSIAWNEGDRKGVANASSGGDLQDSGCMKLSFSDVALFD